MVISVDFGEAVDLEALTYTESVIYEPEQFPGAILKIIEPYKTTVLIFASGKTVITGLTNTNQIQTIIKIVKKLLKELI